jgi:hypothetical protein
MTEHEEAQPRERDVGAGYPEESQPGTGIDAREHAEDDVAGDEGAPQTSTDEDSDPSRATGNPRAAGG